MSEHSIDSLRMHVPKRMVCLICDEEYEEGERTCPFDQSTLVELQEPWKPDMIIGGKYEITEAITDGGMGRIYKARHTLMNRVVAIKTILPTLITSKAAMKRLLQEANALSLLDHPNILRVSDVGVEGGQPYLVMDYIEGTNLDHMVKKGHPILASRAVPMFISAAAGLAHAHARGVIHRDIKPANIMICDYDGNPDFVKIVDFGIAKLDETELGDAAKLTATGEIFGSPQYMSPEQCGAKPQDVRSDVYSLGCVMYFALTGRTPFSGGSPIECMYQQVHGDIPLFAEAVPEITFPRGLEDVVRKCMSKSPDDRFQTMDELQKALEAIRAGHHVTLSIPIPANVAAQVHEQIDQVQKTFGHVHPAVLGLAAFGVVAIFILAFQMMHPAARPEAEDELQPVTRSTASRTTSPSALQPISQQPQVQSQSIAMQPPPVVEQPVSQQAVPQPAATQQYAQPATQQQYAQRYQQAAQPVRQYSLGDYYTQYMQAAQRAQKMGDLYQARSYFKSAHEVAGRFGNADPRYCDSLQSLGRVYYKLGDYQAAKSALEWVVFEKKRRYGESSSEAKMAEKELGEVNQALSR